MSVADYEAAFIDLSRFAYVANEREKCRLFQDGLKLPIQAKTRMQQYISYSDLVQGALEAEDIEKAFSSRRQDKGKTKLSFLRRSPSLESSEGLSDRDSLVLALQYQ